MRQYVIKKLLESVLYFNDVSKFSKFFFKFKHFLAAYSTLYANGVSILIYETDPRNPDPMEITKVTDHVVSSACRGNVALAIQKKQFKDFTLHCEGETRDEKDVANDH